ncbi:MAG: SMODS domain-containing nucleotidyltransferase [Proteocatella sp.]
MSHSVLKRGEVIQNDVRKKISSRYHKITYAINREFWNSSSDTNNSIYVGSYGRNTAINTSDLDVLVILPEDEYERHDKLKGNGQSRLLQSVRQAILDVYPRSEVRADGQVVKILFTDGMKFEILPAFKDINYWGSWNGRYKYPDSNMGGNWCSTNPKKEQEAMQEKNKSSNGLLYDTCKHIRFIRDTYFSSYKLSGIVIDTFVYNAIGNWRWLTEGESTTSSNIKYEQVLLDYLTQNSLFGSLILYAPGSNEPVSCDSSMECLKKVLTYMV